MGAEAELLPSRCPGRSVGCGGEDKAAASAGRTTLLPWVSAPETTAAGFLSLSSARLYAKAENVIFLTKNDPLKTSCCIKAAHCATGKDQQHRAGTEGLCLSLRGWGWVGSRLFLSHCFCPGPGCAGRAQPRAPAHLFSLPDRCKRPFVAQQGRVCDGTPGNRFSKHIAC